MGRPYDKRPADHSLRIRRALQAAFLLLNVWIGVRFVEWVRFFETEGASPYVERPAGVDGWLPIAGLINLKYVVSTHVLPHVHPAGMFLLVAFVLISLLFRKAFCSWLCPIGTLSEWLWGGGRTLFGRNVAVPRWIDVPLRSLKYLLLLFFLSIIGGMSVDDVTDFLASPYALIADVKMLDFFRDPGTTTIAVCSTLVILSVVTKNVWCRYLCPYGALMGLVSLFSPVRITRDPVSCIDCGKCTAACPSLIPVDVLRTVRTPECNGCLTCVSVCPVNDALEMRPVFGRRRLTAPVIAVAVSIVFLTVVGYARLIGAWDSRVPEHLLIELIPNAASIGH